MTKQAHSEQYERVRKDFDDMSIQDRAVFLIEATVATIGRGIEQAGTILADELDNAFRMSREPAAEPPAPGEPGSTSRRRRPATGAATDEGPHIET